MAAQASQPSSPGPLGRAMRWLGRFLLVGLALLVASLVLGRFIPVPSTLMLGRWMIHEPVTREWRALEAISPELVRGVIAAEDQRFCQHWGVDFSALREVLAESEGPSRGASTISMQLAKNLYLWPGRSYLRKGLELPLAILLDIAWGKPRIMEVYLNIAEWGEGIFGAEAAARAYFNKSADSLTAAEAARLVAALPNPKVRTPERPSRRARRVQGRASAIGPLAACVIKDRGG